MKVLRRSEQQQIYKDLVNLLVYIVKDESQEADDALCEVFRIGRLVGVDESLERKEALEESVGYKEE